MTVEILYPELCNLYGDRGNMAYFRQCIQGRFVETPLEQEPFFASHPVDMVYLGSMTESSCARILDRLAPYREKIAQLIEQNTVFLLTGNATELFCQSITTETGQTIPALGLTDLTATRFLPRRANSLVLAYFDKIKITGYTSRFSHIHGVNQSNALFTVKRGLGSEPGSRYEGFRLHNVFGTRLLGPLLVLNPDFNLYLQGLMGVSSPNLAFEDEVREAYSIRLAEFEKKETNFPGHLA